MKRSRSLATAAGVTLAVAGAVSALFLTVGAGASILGPNDSASSGSSSTGSTTETTGTTIGDMSDAEVYTLDEKGRLIPFEDSDSTGGSTTTVPARENRYDSYHEDDDNYDDSYHEDDDNYDDDNYEDDDNYDDSYHEDDDHYDDGDHDDDDDHYEDDDHHDSYHEDHDDD